MLSEVDSKLCIVLLKETCYLKARVFNDEGIMHVETSKNSLYQGMSI